jgi:hypothetical protein
LHFRKKKEETEVQAGIYAKYILGSLNIVVWLMIYAGYALDDEGLLMGGYFFGIMLLVSYYVPAKFVSKSAREEKKDSWSAFIKWVNISAIAGLMLFSYVHKLLWGLRGR